MAVTNYGSLKAWVADLLGRSSDYYGFGTNVVPDLIVMTEAEINARLRISAMESVVAGTLSGATLAHPTNFLQARRLVVNQKVYTYRTPDMFQMAEDSGAYFYTSIGTNLHILDGTSGLAYSLMYYAAFPNLSASADTNVALQTAPHMYLYGAAKHAADYFGDYEGHAQWEQRFERALAQAQARDLDTRYPGGLEVVAR